MKQNTNLLDIEVIHSNLISVLSQYCIKEKARLEGLKLVYSDVICSKENSTVTKAKTVSKKTSKSNDTLIANIDLEKYTALVNLMENRSFHRDLKEALDHHFEVLVMAPMSSGKSTLINAMLNHELLPVANKACTSTIFRIEDNDSLINYKCKVVSESSKSSNWKRATRSLLTDINKAENSIIEIKGNLPFVKNAGAQLVLYDTPGPNYSSDKRHAEILDEALRNQKFGLIIFVINAGFHGTNDEMSMLGKIVKLTKENQLFNKRTVFVLNQVDRFIVEGEDLCKIVKRKKQKLIEIGFDKPQIIPMMASAADLLRKTARNEKLTDLEDNNLIKYKIILKTNPFITTQSAIIDESIKQTINLGIAGQGNKISESSIDMISNTINENELLSLELNKLLYSTGIHTLEAYLEYLITKEALPETMKRITKVLNKHNTNNLFK